MQKMADRERSDFYVVFTMTLSMLGSYIKYVNNLLSEVSEAIWSSPVIISFITYQTQKLRPQRIMVETVYKSDLPWSTIFSVIVYAKGLSNKRFRS